MNKNNFNEFIKEKLNTNEFVIPEHYDEVFENTIEKISHHNKFNLKNWIIRNKVASIIILLIGALLTSVTTMATINSYQSRMETLSNNELKKYNDNIQNVTVDADKFSRDLSKEEQSMLDQLRDEYENGNILPHKSINQYEDFNTTIKKGLFYIVNESKFYLPDRKLTKEELLEIIDLQEKQAYSVRSKNKQSNTAIKSNDDKVLDSDSILKIIEDTFNIAVSDLNRDSISKNDEDTEIVFSSNDRTYSVYQSSAHIDRILVSLYDIPAHKNNVKINKKSLNTIKDNAKKQVEKFTNQQVKQIKMYSLMNEDKLLKGTISIYCQLIDGSGCVAVYSLNYKNIYDIYLEDIDSIKKDLDDKIVKAKTSGYLYKKIG